MLFFQPCGEVQVIQEDLPLRTPRDAVGRLAPLRNLRAPPPHASQAKHIAHRYEDDDSDAISEESFERELSLTERRLHQSAVLPHYGCDMIDVSNTSDDEKLVCESVEKSNLSDSISSFYPEGDRSEKDCLDRGEKLISGRQSRKWVGWKKASVSRLREVPRAFWPYWVYRMHDSYCLAQKAAGTPFSLAYFVAPKSSYLISLMHQVEYYFPEFCSPSLPEKKWG